MKETTADRVENLLNLPDFLSRKSGSPHIRACPFACLTMNSSLTTFLKAKRKVIGTKLA